MAAAKPVFISAGMVLVRPLRPVNFLILRAYRNWDFPKGMLQPKELPLQAALRELREETGLQASDIKMAWGDGFYRTPLYRSAHDGKPCLKLGHFHLAEFNGEVDALTLSEEHQEARWVSREAAAKLLVPRLLAVLTWAQGIIDDRTR